MVSKGDILYALYGATSGEVGRSRINGAINQAILAILPHDGYDSKFLMQWLRKSKQSITDVYLQGGQGNLSGAIVKALEVDFPSVIEQRQIGNYFQSFDNLITLHQRKQCILYIMKKILCGKSKQLEKSISWEQRKVSGIGNIVTGSTPKTSVSDNYGGEFLFVSPADIQENRYVDETITTLTKKDLTKVAK